MNKQEGQIVPAGLTLVELLIGTALLIGGVSSLLFGMGYAVAHATYLSQFQVAMNAAQGTLEQLMVTPFDTLWADALANPNGQLVCTGEDANWNGALDAGEDTNGNGLLDGARLSIQIRQSPEDAARNPGNPALLDVHVAACWTTQERRVGEDQNCNGQLDAGEDTNANTWIDSPVMVSTRIATGD